MEEEPLPLTDSEVLQIVIMFAICYGVPILLYCYFKYYRKHEKTNQKIRKS